MAAKPRFDGEWVRLGDLGNTQAGGTPSSKHPEFFTGTIPWIGTTALNGGLLDESNAVKMITEEAVAKSATKIVPAGSIMVGIRVGVGKVAINAVPMCTSQDIVSITGIDTDQWNKEYISLALQYKAPILASQAQGATITGITSKTLKSITIPVLALSSQNVVVSQLRGIDRQIACAKKRLEFLGILVKSRFAEMFGDPVSNDRGWVVSTIKETASTYGDGPFGSNLKTSDYVDEGVRVIRLGNIQQGRFSEKDRSFVSYEKYELLKRYECLPGEIVIATLGDPILRACLVPGSCSPSIHKADCMYYEVDRNKLIPTFAMWAINHSSMLRRAMVDAHGQTRGRINSTQAGNLPMVVPPLALQQEFADFAAEVDKSRFVVRS